MKTPRSPLAGRRTNHRPAALRQPVQQRLPITAHLFALLMLAAPVAFRPIHAQAHSRLVLQIHSIRCVDESNGKYMERIGGDEIVLSGVAIDPAGRATRVSTLRAGKFNKDGDTKRYSPPRAFHTFDLASGPDFPRSFGMMFVVVERDEGGGFQSVVNALVNRANEVVAPKPNGSTNGSTELLTRALTAASTGNVPGALAQLLGERVVGLISGKLRDDIFPPQLGELELRSATARISKAGPTTNVRTVRTKAHGGKYEIKYSWRVE